MIGRKLDGERRSARIALRPPREVRLGEQPALLLELSTGGARVEHQERVMVASRATLHLPGFDVTARVRYETALPGSSGIVYHTGLQFTDVATPEATMLEDLLRAEVQRQVEEWEANLNGVPMPPRPVAGPRSSVLQRYLWLHLTSQGWVRKETSDPNQPLDGLAIPADQPLESIALLCKTYENADPRTRDYLRTCATLAIMDRMRRS